MMTELLDLAGDLVSTGPSGRVKSIALRKATSTAYYALFHALARLCAERLVGWSKPWAFVTPIYRSLEHKKARDVFNAIQRENRGSSQSLIGATFAALQDARHDADYNPEPFKLNRTGTVELIGAARQAIDLLHSLAPDEKLALAVRLIARPRRTHD